MVSAGRSCNHVAGVSETVVRDPDVVSVDAAVIADLYILRTGIVRKRDALDPNAGAVIAANRHVLISSRTRQIVDAIFVDFEITKGDVEIGIGASRIWRIKHEELAAARVEAVRDFQSRTVTATSIGHIRIGMKDRVAGAGRIL